MTSGRISTGPDWNPGTDFSWRDGARTVVMRSGAAFDLPGLLEDHDVVEYELLSTARALADAPGLDGHASKTHQVETGSVADIASGLLDGLGAATETLVAFGGGRVIDTAKAIASISGAAVVAIPTTLSGAEMTDLHRFPSGAEHRASGPVRPELVIADPDLMTSQPEADLRASAMNALAHGADSLYTPFANPISRITALSGSRLIAEALEPDQATRGGGLALGAIFCGYAIDSGRFAIHHVVCQTLVGTCGSSHAETNSSILPGAMAMMRDRAPLEIALFAQAIGSEPDEVAARISALGRPPGLGAAGADRSRLEQALDEIEARPELRFAPQPPGRSQIRELVEAAW